MKFYILHQQKVHGDLLKDTKPGRSLRCADELESALGDKDNKERSVYRASERKRNRRLHAARMLLAERAKISANLNFTQSHRRDSKQSALRVGKPRHYHARVLSLLIHVNVSAARGLIAGLETREAREEEDS